METQGIKTKPGRLLLLVFSSTIIAEVLSGSTTLSRIQFLPTQFLLYGSAAVFIREVSRRLNAGWPTTILLGLAFGMTLEGLVLQSVFNPEFLTNNLTFGRSLGTNWVWTAYMAPFHSFFSICTPILLCELVFDDNVHPWASRTGTWIAGILLLLLLIAFHFLFIKLTHFNTGLLPNLILVTVIVLTIYIAWKVRKVRPVQHPHPIPRRPYHFWVITVVSLVAACLWYAGFKTIFMANKPAPWMALSAALIIAGSYFMLISLWSVTRIYTTMDRLALVSGLLTGETLFGYFATAGNSMDHNAQLVLMVIVVVLLILLYIKVGKRPALHEQQ